MPSSKQWILANKPTDLPTLSGPSPTFKLTTADVSKPSSSQALVKTLMFSNDPAQRTWIVPNADPERLYFPPVQEGSPMSSFALAEVVESGSPNELPVGSLVLGPTNWTEYSVHEIKTLQQIQPIEGLDLGHFLGALGMTAVTAYYGIKEVVCATKDDTVVVSGAAGATGSMVVQIAKKIIGCKRVSPLTHIDTYTPNGGLIDARVGHRYCRYR
jgi:NADPH-dependent curcumin reductase CurA